MRKKISVPCIFAERNEKSVRQGTHSASSAVASATISPRASTHNHVFCTIGNEISYRTKKCRLVTNRHFHKFRAGKGTRTLDLLITNQLRYQLRYSSGLNNEYYNGSYRILQALFLKIEKINQQFRTLTMSGDMQSAAGWIS